MPQETPPVSGDIAPEPADDVAGTPDWVFGLAVGLGLLCTATAAIDGIVMIAKRWQS